MRIIDVVPMVGARARALSLFVCVCVWGGAYVCVQFGSLVRGFPAGID